jgi:hypothetical protein
MIGNKVYCLFRDGYGNPNGGLHFCEVVDKVMVMPKGIRRNNIGQSVAVAETHYIVRTIDPSPEIRSKSYVWESRIDIVHCLDISFDLENAR